MTGQPHYIQRTTQPEGVSDVVEYSAEELLGWFGEKAVKGLADGEAISVGSADYVDLQAFHRAIMAGDLAVDVSLEGHSYTYRTRD